LINFGPHFLLALGRIRFGGLKFVLDPLVG